MDFGHQLVASSYVNGLVARSFLMSGLASLFLLDGHTLLTLLSKKDRALSAVMAMKNSIDKLGLLLVHFMLANICLCHHGIQSCGS